MVFNKKRFIKQALKTDVLLKALSVGLTLTKSKAYWRTNNK
jgi:hypothetical protein